ncbi:MAG: TonB family protein [Verrucomicrobiota bacterium]
MISPAQRCLLLSAGVHLALLGALVVLPGFVSRPPAAPPDLPPVQLIDTRGLRLTEGLGAGGGTPAPPVRPPQQATPPAAPATPPPPAPAPVRPPVAESRPTPVETPPRPVRSPRPVEVSRERVRSTTPEPAARRVEISREVRRRSPNEVAEAEAAREQAARERSAQAERDYQRRLAQWKQQLGGIRQQLAQGLTAETEISVPGPGGGGEVWMGYASYLKAFYETRWERPATLSQPVAFVGVSITVTRSGQLKDYQVVERSGIPSLDDSVVAVLRRFRQLAPLPEGSRDPERTFRIKFRLEGTSSL